MERPDPELASAPSVPLSTIVARSEFPDDPTEIATWDACACGLAG
jgi:hypothetical protein